MAESPVYSAVIYGDSLQLNSMYRNVPRVGRVLTEKAKAWKANAGKCLLLTRPVAFPPGSRLSLSLRFCGRWEAKAGTLLMKDLDGAIKSVQDVVCAYLGVDDSHIVALQAVKSHQKKGAEMILIEVRAVQS